MLCEVGVFSIPVNSLLCMCMSYMNSMCPSSSMDHNCGANIVNVLSAGPIVAICIDVNSPVSTLALYLSCTKIRVSGRQQLRFDPYACSSSIPPKPPSPVSRQHSLFAPTAALELRTLKGCPRHPAAVPANSRGRGGPYGRRRSDSGALSRGPKEYVA